jgi:outer membrane immunogenic protein
MRRTLNTLLCGTAGLAMMAAVDGVQAGDFLPPPMPAAAVHDWTGFYIGGHVGWGDANFKGEWHTFECIGDICTDYDFFPGRGPEGIIGGIHAGYNWHHGVFLLGAEADLTKAWMENSGILFEGTEQRYITEVDGLASIRGRLGMAFDRFNVYGTGGVGFVSASFSGATDNSDVMSPISLNDWGPVVGVGGEWAVSERVSLRTEALWYFFDKKKPIHELNDIGETGDFAQIDDVFTVRVGFSYKFGGPFY